MKTVRIPVVFLYALLHTALTACVVVGIFETIRHPHSGWPVLIILSGATLAASFVIAAQGAE